MSRDRSKWFEMAKAHTRRDESDKRIERALEIILRYGGIQESHHQAWVIDQVVRVLTGDGYEQWVRDAKAGEDGPDTYTWETGIAP